jgi:hypothetical protein
MSEEDPRDRDAAREADAAAAEAGAIGGRAPENADPERRPVEEAGGGESEGFEQAEEDLREHTEHGYQAPSPTETAFTPEQESDEETIERAEADDIRSTERPDED